MKAFLRSVRISPKKANLVAGMVRGRKAEEALELLKLIPKKGGNILYKVVQSAVSNAKNNFNQSTKDLFITKIHVTKGPTYKRSLPISRGRVHPILKRTSHITVEVGLKEESGKKEMKSLKEKSSVQSAEKKLKKTTAKKTTPSKANTVKKSSASKASSKKS